MVIKDMSDEVKELAANAFSLNGRKMNFKLLCEALKEVDQAIESVERHDFAPLSFEDLEPWHMTKNYGSKICFDIKMKNDNSFRFSD